jgi:hypothetical protein
VVIHNNDEDRDDEEEVSCYTDVVNCGLTPDMREHFDQLTLMKARREWFQLPQIYLSFPTLPSLALSYT